jgi:hypothetical protein
VRRGWIVIAVALLASCRSGPPAPGPSQEEARLSIEQALPASLNDKSGWAEDIYQGFEHLTVTPSRENVCAVVAVIAQESSFRVDPVVPNLGSIARQEIDRRAANAHVPQMLVHGVLTLKSADGRTYEERIGAARTEKDLSEIYEEFISSVPLGRTLFEDKNPIRTRGPMQVNVAFAEQFAAAAPYPYPIKRSIPDELFTRRGSLYFGIAHLLDYRAPYSDYLYRFADYNAGQYASRNAAFQHALAVAGGATFSADGALLPHDASASPGNTELAARALRVRLGLSDAAIHEALSEGKSKSFEQTPLYQKVFELAEHRAGRAMPRARIPAIELKGPKLKRTLSTQWYAERVDQRFKRCLRSP